MREVDVLVVGLGFAGATAARSLAEGGLSVHAMDRRAHIAGNAYDEYDAAGVLVHRYGPHLFHTSSSLVFEFLSRFTSWHPYEHRVLARVGEQLVPFPINRQTLNLLYGLSLDAAGAAALIARVRQPRAQVATSEDVVLNAVGPDLCEKLFRGYSRKHWGLELDQLDAGVAARIPIRVNDDDRYFSDTFQCMPAEGYTRMFERMLNHPAISYETGRDWSEVRSEFTYRHLLYTGPIDAYFGFQCGHLGYRSVQFEHEHRPDIAWLQPVATINYPNDFAYTRVSEFKHITGQVHPGTSILREYPCAVGEPLYPIPRPANQAMVRRYKALADRCESVTFLGRLAQYRYYDMDQVVASALVGSAKIRRKLERR